MLKICYVIENGSSLNGSEQSLLNLIYEIKREEDVEIHAVNFSHRPELESAMNEIGVNVDIIHSGKPFRKIANSDITVKSLIRRTAKKVIIRVSIPQAIWYLCKNRINIVHANTSFVSPTLLYAARILKIPYVWHIREFLDKDHGLEYIDKRSYEQLIADSAKVIMISRAVQSFWEKRIERECTLIYNGIPLDKCYVKRENLFSKRQLNILVTGRVSEGKGQMDVVQAINELVNSGMTGITVYLVGFRGIGDYERKVRNYVQKHELCDYIKMIDFTRDLAQYREICNVGIMSSISEAFGRVTVEYMASGLLTIGTNAGGTPEIIEDGKSGLLYEVGDYRSLAGILMGILERRDEMEGIAFDGQQRAMECFSIKRTAKQVYDLYEEVLGFENQL